MHNINHCPSCHSTNCVLTPGRLARFVVWQIIGSDPESNVPTQLLHCKDCDFICSQTRFTPEEEQALYTDYRGEVYNQRRVTCEPEYQTHIDSYNFEAELEGRKLGIDYLITQHLDPLAVNTVLDYGGNDGAFIPHYFFNATKYVYDTSGNQPVEGVLPYNKDTGPKPVDVIMCCHTLEHLSDPDIVLNDIKELVSSGSYAYFEVPVERANYNHPYSENLFHEHINMFHEQSLEALLTRHNFEIVETFRYTHLLCILTKIK